MSNALDYLVVYGDSYSGKDTAYWYQQNGTFNYSILDVHPGSKRTNGPVWSQQLANKWNTQLVSYAKPGATFCQNDKSNSSWLKQQVEQDTTIQEAEKSSVHAIFLGVTDLVETQGEAKNIKKWVQCIKDQVVSTWEGVNVVCGGNIFFNVCFVRCTWTLTTQILVSLSWACLL